MEKERIEITQFLDTWREGYLGHEIQIKKIKIQLKKIEEKKDSENSFFDYARYEIKVLVNDEFSLFCSFEGGLYKIKKFVKEMKKSKKLYLNDKKADTSIMSGVSEQFIWNNPKPVEKTCRVFFEIEVYRSSLTQSFAFEKGVPLNTISYQNATNSLLRNFYESCPFEKKNCKSHCNFEKQYSDDGSHPCCFCWREILDSSEWFVTFGKSKVLDNFLKAHFPKTIEEFLEVKAEYEDILGGGDGGHPKMSMATYKIAGAGVTDHPKLIKWVEENFSKFKLSGNRNKSVVKLDNDTFVWVRYPQKDGYSVCVVLNANDINGQIEYYHNGLKGQESFKKFVVHTQSLIA